MIESPRSSRATRPHASATPRSALGRTAWALLPAACAVLLSAAVTPARADDAATQAAFDRSVRPLLRTYCYECHSGDLIEAQVDFEGFDTLDAMRRDVRVWQRVGEMLAGRQMPPRDAKQPSDAERGTLQGWVGGFLKQEAIARAGDAGRVVLRRLNNAEYTYTIRDLTGVASLDPAREFPTDNAAGEGFTNTGNALVMSPSLVTKYLDAAKAIADHAVLLPDGLRFSPGISRRDWTEEYLARIREFYARYTVSGGGTQVNLQGIKFDTNQGGRVPLEAYLAATLGARDDLRDGRTTPEAIARANGLNARYMTALVRALSDEPGRPRSVLLDRLRERWRKAGTGDAKALVAVIEGWQSVLWKVNPIGHIGRHLGREDGPRSWIEPVTPLSDRQDVRIPLKPSPGEKELVVYLTAADAGGGSADDLVVWENPRLVAPGRSDLSLRDLRPLAAALEKRRRLIASSVGPCMAAAAEVSDAPGEIAVAEAAKKHGVDPVILSAWLDYLGIGGGRARIGTYLTQKMERTEAYDFIKGWVGGDALSVVANSSDQYVRIPGNMKPHGIAVHPTPVRSVIVAWRSPIAEPIRIEGTVQHAHPECGNGVTWALELRRGKTRQTLAAGTAQGAMPVKIGPIASVAVQRDDLLALVVGPRDGNHSCDLTAVDFVLAGKERTWDLAREVAPNILAGNPHADGFGHADVWQFGSEPDRGGPQWTIPANSLLARWQAAASVEEKARLAGELEALFREGTGARPADSPDAVLHRQLTSLGGPLLSAVRESLQSVGGAKEAGASDSPVGLDPAEFGRGPNGVAVDPLSLCVKAPATIEVRLPADLVEGCEFVTTGRLHAKAGPEAGVLLQAGTSPPAPADLAPGQAVIVREGGPARARFEAAFDDARGLFPPALCYTRIVPVDEVVTLNLYYREDDHLRRLMLDDAQTAELDRLWDELLYVSQEPVLLAAAFEQIYEYATQDRPDMVKAFGPMRGPIAKRTADFRARLVATEGRHVHAVLGFAARAYRRPLEEHESRTLRELYRSLRKQEIPHEEAVRLTLARVLVAPAFLYHVEKPGPGAVQRPVSDYELASRLSYFLWSSAPDEELLRCAAEGRLGRPEVLSAQTRRMLRDDKVRRLATEFGAQWLHIQGFDQHDEKSERHFPTFNALRGAMYEESIRYLTELFRNDGSVLEVLDSDYTYLNEDLARHYGIPGVQGPEWRRVDGIRRFGRGGMLTHATVLAKQSGASRTSPILRGNWLSEVVLGEKLPRPPKNVPQLPETAPDGLTERRLIERHSQDPACAKCHVRIDPLGFALENFDAIGRFREKDAAGLAIDARTRLQDGTALDGYEGLRKYVKDARREAFLRQFDRKLLGYALGRSVQLSDELLLEDLLATLKSNEGRVAEVIEAIVLSRPFREIRGRDRAADD